MYLEIDNPDNLELEAFTNWLRDQIIDYVEDTSTRETSLGNLWSEYFENNDLGWARDESNTPVAPSTDFILNSYFDNLIINKNGYNYIITVDPNIKVKGTNLTIDALSALINYGTLLVPPYPYIDDIFELFSDRLQEYYNIWLKETGRSLLNYEESGGEV